jgi:hypothetical protein
MMELHDRLDALAGSAVPATPDQAEADLARGRRALRRRRTVKGAATGVFAVAAAAAALAYGTASPPAGHPTAAAPTAAAPATAAAVTTLVAYKGDQPKGYTIDKVPAGWEIQGNSDFALTIAPIGAADRDPDAFVGKIVIMLQSKDQHGRPPGTAMKVDGKPAVLDDVSNLPSKLMYVMQPNGVYLIVQIWDARGWTDSAIADFAAGVHVLPNAQQGVG